MQKYDFSRLVSWALILLVFGSLSIFAQDDDETMDLSDFGDKKEKAEKKEELKVPKKEKEELKVPKEEKIVEKQKPDPKKQKMENQKLYEEEKDFQEESFREPVRIKDDRSTRYITISGNLGVFFQYRDRLFSDSNLGRNTTEHDEDFWDPRVSLQLDIYLEKNIRAVLEFQSENRASIFHPTSYGNLYITNRRAGNEFSMEIEKAYLQFEKKDFILNGASLSFKAGIIPHKYSMRPNGQSFFLNLGEAESPFNTREDTHAIGVLTTWKPKNEVELYVDAFYFVTSESSFEQKDESIFGINIDLDMSRTVKNEDESSVTLTHLFSVMFNIIENDNKPIFTMGMGFNHHFSPDPKTYIFELYGEGFFQFGKYHDTFLYKDQDHLAFAGYIGTKFKYQASKLKPYLDLSLWYLSGDDDNPKSRKNRDVVTYEDIDSTLIVEDNDYGMDIDSNYWAVKLQSGVNLNSIFKEEIRLELLYAHLEALDTMPGRSKRIGEEIDIRITWEYSPDLIFSVVAGFLFHSDYLKGAFRDVGARSKSSTFMVRFESMLRF